jgi:hypothetical protein
MKKYLIWGQIGSISFRDTIEADQFDCDTSGAYVFRNFSTREMWCYPIYRTVVKLIVE